MFEEKRARKNPGGSRALSCLLATMGGLMIMASHPPARACGQNMHAWVTVQAVETLPEGELKDLLTGPEAERMLRNGCMFPDGGYANSLRDYAETLHWEPFQDRYLEWIRASYQPPWSDEAARHIAFLMGMASHGMADQLFDATFMESSKVNDPVGWQTCTGILCGFDTFTDILWTQRQGAQLAPELWVPEHPVSELMRDGFQIEVPPDKIFQSQVVVSMALKVVQSFAADPNGLKQEKKDYPWAFANIENPKVAGTPPLMAPMVARYFQVLYARLRGQPWADQPPLGVMAGNEQYELVREARNPESWISMAFPRGLDKPALKQEQFQIRSSKGEPVQAEAVLFYGHSSHVVSLRPKNDWAPDETYTIEIAPGILGYDGVPTTSPFTFQVSTGPKPLLPTPPPDVTVVEEPAPEPDSTGCATHNASPSILALLALAWICYRQRAR